MLLHVRLKWRTGTQIWRSWAQKNCNIYSSMPTIRSRLNFWAVAPEISHGVQSH
ncbi:unnamed protein product [Rhodiola kirilowii]